MKNKALKITLISITLVSIIILLYAYLCVVFTPKNENSFGGNRYYNYLNFKKEQKNSLDIIVYGDSDAYCGYNPMEVYGQTGATSYVRAGPDESLCNVQKNIEETLKTQSPNLIIIDVDCFFNKNTIFSGSYAQKFMPLVAPIYYHRRWKELTIKDFVTFPKAKLSKLKGYYIKTEVFDYKVSEDFMEDKDAKPQNLQKSVIKNFANIYKLCKNKNIDLKLVCLPTAASWTMAKSKAITQLANEYNVQFLDLNIRRDDFQLDLEKSFSDAGYHLNFSGSTYVTNYLIDYLKESYNFIDHRNDEKYESWNKLYEDYLKVKETL